MNNGFMFASHCLFCDSALSTVRSGGGTARTTTAVVECNECGAQYALRVDLRVISRKGARAA